MLSDIAEMLLRAQGEVAGSARLALRLGVRVRTLSTV